MKLLLLASSLLLPAALGAADAPFAIVDRGEYFQTWARGTERTLPNGEKQFTTNSYTELGSCLNYQENGVWRPSQDLIELLPDGATARHGPHKAIFADDLHAPDALTLFDREGRKLQASLLGIAYSHPASGRSVLFAATRSCIGELVGDTEVWYRDCLEGCRADVRITATKRGIEHDVIFRAQPPPPARFHLPAEGTVMQVWSAFRGAPPARLVPGPGGTNQGVVRIDFGGLFIGRGRAFALQDQPRRRGLPSSAGHGLEIHKAWQTLHGCDWLVESLPYSAALPHLLRLPKDPLLGAKDAPQPRPLLEALQAHANVMPATQPRAPRRMTRALPPPSPAAPVQAVGVKTEGLSLPPRLSALGPEPSQGFVWDYVILNGASDGLTLKGGTTYYIGSDVLLGGLTTLEGAAILKYTNGARLEILGSLACRTAPFQPAIATARDDDTVGTVLPGSTGQPANYYAAPAFYFWNQNSDLHDVRIAYAAQALWYDYASALPHRLAHAQLLHCQTAIVADAARFGLRNVLCYDIVTNFHNSVGDATTGTCEQVTFDQVWAVDGSANVTLHLTNCLLVDVEANFTGANNAWGSSTDFIQVGAGKHYLRDDTYRQAGTTNIHPVLLAELRQRTTYPPVLLSNVVDTETLLTPCVPRNGAFLPIGYSYDPIDYAVNNLQITNATLLLTNGVVVAAYGEKGFDLQAGASLISEGGPLALNRLISYQTVQDEAPVWGGSMDLSPTVFWRESSYPRPHLSFRFTDFARLHGMHFGSPNGNLLPGSLTLHSCQVRGGRVVVDSSEDSPDATALVSLTNNVFERASLELASCSSRPDALAVHLRNNLFKGCTLSFSYCDQDTPAAWELHDNLFDSVEWWVSGAVLANSHNGYVNTTNLPNSAGGDVTLAAVGYEIGPLGRYYLPAHSPLIGAGSLTNAALAGFFHYTATVDQRKASNAPLNIGPYSVALDRSGDTTTVWLDDNPGPNWASYYSDTGSNVWSWPTDPRYSGANAHDSPTLSGVHEHYFYGATTTLTLQPGDRFFTYVRLGTNPAPTTVLLQWGTTDATWDHLACWGADHDSLWWPRDFVGPLPYPGGWVRLEVPVEQVDLDGRTVHGLGFGLCDGSAVWDYSGKVTPGPLRLYDGDGDGIPDYQENRSGSGSYDPSPGSGETDWQTYNSLLGIGSGPGLKVFTPLR